MPRKGYTFRFDGFTGPGFNEAGAVMPRKGSRDLVDANIDFTASMRPGLLCPGRAR